MIKLPFKFKKQIISFIKEYEKLAQPRKLEITCKASVSVCWASDETLDITNYTLDEYSSKEILRENRKIKEFCDKADNFGKKYFNNKVFLWESVLWGFRPENGESFDFKQVEWTKE